MNVRGSRGYPGYIPGFHRWMNKNLAMGMTDAGALNRLSLSAFSAVGERRPLDILLLYVVCRDWREDTYVMRCLFN